MKEYENVARTINEIYMDKIIKAVKNQKIDVILGGIPYLTEDKKMTNRYFIWIKMEKFPFFTIKYIYLHWIIRIPL